MSFITPDSPDSIARLKWSIVRQIPYIQKEWLNSVMPEHNNASDIWDFREMKDDDEFFSFTLLPFRHALVIYIQEQKYRGIEEVFLEALLADIDQVYEYDRNNNISVWP